ncbi:MAG: hypothetical protein ABSH49_01460 [Bryobacteraceae bacterium]|jgi:hypothetical protein
MWHRVKDLSPDQRLVLEGLLGRAFEEDEGLNIQPGRILKDAPVGDDRARAYGRYLQHLDALAERVKGVPDDELDALIEEAFDHVRHLPAGGTDDRFLSSVNGLQLGEF